MTLMLFLSAFAADRTCFARDSDGLLTCTNGTPETWLTNQRRGRATEIIPMQNDLSSLLELADPSPRQGRFSNKTKLRPHYSGLIALEMLSTGEDGQQIREIRIVRTDEDIHVALLEQPVLYALVKDGYRGPKHRPIVVTSQTRSRPNAPKPPTGASWIRIDTATLSPPPRSETHTAHAAWSITAR